MGTDYSYPALCFLEIPLEEEVIKEKRVVVDDSIFCHSMSLSKGFPRRSYMNPKM